MAEQYTNPVLNRSAPDPFVFKHRGVYYCISTHSEPRQRKFEMLRSPDLVHWQVLGGALEPLAEPHPHYWAPEITYLNGVFHLYYSVGNETFMQLRVATSRNPGGPYIDRGIRLTKEDFAIDAHIFMDDDAQMYLFYATDFLEYERIGTGTVVDRMLDPFTPAGAPRPVARACHEWQVYDPARIEKGGVKWHTVEGSFVLKRKGRYYHMFSGGNWTNQSYGVAYAATDHLLRPDEWAQPCDGQETPLVIRTLSGLVVGPGHNSVVRGPDNRQLYCVYHRWVDGARVLSIDPLDWAGDRLFVLGPSHTPQPVPTGPTITGFEQAEMEGGQWEQQGDEIRQRSARHAAQARWSLPAPQFVFEVTLRADTVGEGAYGVRLLGPGKARATLALRPEQQALVIMTGRAQRVLSLPAGFDPRADHLLRVEVESTRVAVMVDNIGSHWLFRLPFEPYDVAVFTDGLAATFAAPEITLGWEDLFHGPETAPAELGWEGDGDWRIVEGELRSPELTREAAMVAKAVPTDAYEWVVNVRVIDTPAGGCGFMPALSTEMTGPLIGLERTKAGWLLQVGDAAEDTGATLPLPERYDPTISRQWRFRVAGGLVSIACEGEVLATTPLLAAGTHIALAASKAVAAFEMVRVTALPDTL